MSDTQRNEQTVTVAIAGAAGRMGQRLVALSGETPGIELAGAFEQPGHEAIGTDSGELAGVGANGVPVTEGPQTKEDVLIDFTSPEVTEKLLRLCAQEDIGMVIGTTGFDRDTDNAIDETARSIPVVQAPNMSLGVNLLFSMAARTAQQLGDDYDIEILESHHRFKKDAPSGTAKGLAHAICEATGKDPDRDVVYARQGHDPRERGKLTVQSLRMGDVVGEHTVYLAGLGERIQLGHVASSRDTFARGALRAAQWLKGRPRGRYSMKDVLGLSG